MSPANSSIGEFGPPTWDGPFGFNVIGNVTSNTGLGVVARKFVRLLLAKGCPVAIWDQDPGGGRGKHDLTFESYAVCTPEDLPYCINFFVLQPTALFSVVAEFRQVFLKTDRLNVDLVMWELAVLPAIWLEVMKVLDVVAAASDFIGATFAARLGNIATISAPCPIYMPRDITPSRRQFALPAQGTLFVTSFDPNSDIQRKNPFAAVSAFRSAFAGDTRAHLVIRANNAKTPAPAQRAVAQLRQICATQPNIHIIDTALSYGEVLSLYATCDVFVSLHRSEGLGLGLMEAMALGKPVIATGWSGNMSFMNHTNSCLVGYDLVPVDGTLPVYRKDYLGANAMWADAHIGEAAAWMKRLADDRNALDIIGKAAAADMARYQRNAEAAHFIEELRAILEHLTVSATPRARAALNMRLLWEAANLQHISYHRALIQSVHRTLHRHILWRFSR